MADTAVAERGRLDTLPKLLRRNQERWGSRVAFRDKEFGIWTQYTWGEVYEQVKEFSLGLVSLGLTPGDKVAVIGDNEPQWYWAAYAAYAARGVVVGLFTDASPSEIEYILDHSEATFVVARDQEQVDKLLAVAPKLSRIRRIIWWYPRGMRGYRHPLLMSFQEVAEMGRAYKATHPDLFERLIAESAGQDIANIYYTSGTTGTPKGVMCSHEALIGSTEATLSLVALEADDHILCYLPPAWVGESFLGLIPHLLTGAILHTLEEPETLMQDIREVTPALILGGARQWEGWVSIIQARIADAGWIERTLYRLLLPVGGKVAALRLEGKAPGLLWKGLHLIANALVLRPIRAYLGLTRAKLPATAGTVLGPDTFRFIHSLGIPLHQVYGSTEGGMVTGHRAEDIRWGTVGPPLPGVQVQISPEGEILVKSPYLFSEYWKDAEATRRAFTPDGWWRSGDAGRFDGHGHLVYLDRVSELGELRSGDRYSPQHIESGLRFCPYVRDAMVVGGKTREFVAAVIIIDFSNVGKWAERKRIPYTTYTDLSQRPEVARLIQGEVERLNADLPSPARIQRFVCLSKEFDPDEGDVTRTRKLKRAALTGRYGGLIEAIYRGEETCAVDATVTYQDGRQGVVTTAIRIHSVPKAGAC